MEFTSISVEETEMPGTFCHNIQKTPTRTYIPSPISHSSSYSSNPHSFLLDFILLYSQGPTAPLGYNQRFFSRDLDHYHTSQRPSAGTNFRRSRSTEWDREGQERRRGEDHGELGRKEELVRRGNIERGGGAFHMNTASRYHQQSKKIITTIQ